MTVKSAGKTVYETDNLHNIYQKVAGLFWLLFQKCCEKPVLITWRWRYKCNSRYCNKTLKSALVGCFHMGLEGVRLKILFLSTAICSSKNWRTDFCLLMQLQFAIFGCRITTKRFFRATVLDVGSLSESLNCGSHSWPWYLKDKIWSTKISWNRLRPSSSWRDAAEVLDWKPQSSLACSDLSRLRRFSRWPPIKLRENMTSWRLHHSLHHLKWCTLAPPVPP